MYCSLSNYLEPNEFGNHFVLELCFRYIGDALDACLILKEGVFHHMHIGVNLR